MNLDTNTTAYKSLMLVCFILVLVGLVWFSNKVQDRSLIFSDDKVVAQENLKEAESFNKNTRLDEEEYEEAIGLTRIVNHPTINYIFVLLSYIALFSIIYYSINKWMKS